MSSGNEEKEVAREECVTLEVNSQKLRGMVHSPAGRGPFSAVALFHGCGGQRMEPHFIFVKLSRLLATLPQIKPLDTLSTYRGEALIIHGTEDETVPLEHAYRFKKVLPSSRLRKIGGAGHTYNQVDWEEEVLRETVNFLKEKL